MKTGRTAPAVTVRPLRPDDRAGVSRIDAAQTGRRKPAYWRGIFSAFVESGVRDRRRVALAAEADGQLVGFLVGEVRAFEFGSEPCGWVFAVGVRPDRQRSGVATRLLEEAGRRFRAAGVRTLRTMVHRSDIKVMSFFRASRFVGGSFVQLELDMGESS